jgi:hypothetical protein
MLRAGRLCLFDVEVSLVKVLQLNSMTSLRLVN